MKFLPTARGLLACEQVIVQPKTNIVTLTNCFTKKRVPVFPSPPLKFAVFAALTGGLGKVIMKVMVSRLDDNRMVYSRNLPTEFRDRIIETRFVLRLTDVVFPDPGEYVVELLADGEWVAQTVIKLSL
jgi:hypothetical protein